MANLSQSHFLHSIGWTIINSLWQMAILWFIYLFISHIFQLNSRRKYQLAAIFLFSGFLLSVYSFFSHFLAPRPSSVFSVGLNDLSPLLNKVLVAASVTYLGLLIFPAFRFYKNWIFVQHIQKKGLSKADFPYRLFVRKTSLALGIGKKVAVYISSLITSPVTIGFFKPVILLPMAAMNHLSVQQVEAILLHELAHIKRFDYLVNLFTSFIATLLYFNPFVKLFMNEIEEERENCCDELVLQFEYDTAHYATALLTLEQLSTSTRALVLAATGKNPLLKRIEKMAGMEKKNNFSFRQLGGLLAAILCVFVFNSVLLVRSKTSEEPHIAMKTMANPFLFMPGEEEQPEKKVAPPQKIPSSHMASVQRGALQKEASTEIDLQVIPEEIPPGYMHAGADEVDNSLSKAQKERVSTTVDATKKVMKDLQWKEIENQIAEVMTPTEKAMAKKEFAMEVDKINWNRVESNLKAQYESLDWQAINQNLSNAMTAIELDSIENSLENILNTFIQTEKDLVNGTIIQSPLPDVPLTEFNRMKEEIRFRLELVRGIRDNKIIRL